VRSQRRRGSGRGDERKREGGGCDVLHLGDMMVGGMSQTELEGARMCVIERVLLWERCWTSDQSLGAKE